MSLRHNDNCDFDYNGNPIINSSTQINTVERRLANKKTVIADLQNELTLLEEQALRTYKSNIDYLQLDQKGFINACKDWLHMLKTKTDKNGNKLDGRKSYKEKDIYEYYIGYIKDLLEIAEMNGIEFIDYNFGQATEIRFEYLGHNWELTIPHKDSIDLKAYRHYGAEAFKLKLLHSENSCIWEWVGATYEENELKDIMKKGVEKYCN